MGAEDNKDQNSQRQEVEDDDEVDDGDQEEEVTRCICGQAEYPGPTVGVRDIDKGSSRRTLHHHNHEVHCANVDRP